MPARAQSTGTTFAVNAVKPSRQKVPQAPALLALQQMLGRSVESCSGLAQPMASVNVHHGFLSGVQRAYLDHHDLVLSPDMIWLMIVQGIAQHVALHREELWHHFAGTDTDLVLTSAETDFVPGSPENRWEDVIHDFAQQVHHYVQPAHDAIVAKFSTTGPVETLAFEAALLELVLPYTLYRLTYICGIPEITLQGTTSDWEHLRERVEVLKKYEMGWWHKKLVPILDEFVAASRGEVNGEFWQTMVSSEPGCGGDKISGWIGQLVPYIRPEASANFDTRNPLLKARHEGLRIEAFPRGLSRVPFEWQCQTGRFEMHLLAGFIGYFQKGRALVPRIGWAVARQGEDRIVERLLAAMKDTRPPFDSAALMQAGKRLFSTFDEVPRAMEQLYSRCNGGRVGPYHLWSLGDSNVRWFDVPRAEVPGFEWANSVRMIEFGDFGDGTVAALAVRLGYLYHGAVLRLPKLGKPLQAELIAYSIDEFIGNMLASPEVLYFENPKFVRQYISLTA